jgi:MerR family transcriptional regulator, light-induced transcriptional regulator
MTTGLNIAALAQRTGIAPDTLRKWEQRYAILHPARTAGGQRRYSERDVARVEWLRERLEEGYRIGEAASLLGSVGPTPARSPREHLKGMLDALDDLEPATIGLRLDQAFALLRVEETFEAVLCPLLEAVGDRWQNGTMTTAQEHLVSEAVRSRLAHLLADAGGGVHGVAVLACAPGERHELGLMMATIALRRDGWKVVYLGADAPLTDAFALARRCRLACSGSASRRRRGRTRSSRVCEAARREASRSSSAAPARRNRSPAGSARCTPGRRSTVPSRRFAPWRRSLRA